MSLLHHPYWLVSCPIPSCLRPFAQEKAGSVVCCRSMTNFSKIWMLQSPLRIILTASIDNRYVLVIGRLHYRWTMICAGVIQLLRKASLQNFHGSIFTDACDHAHCTLYNHAYIVAPQEPEHTCIWLRDCPGSQASHEVIYNHKNVHWTRGNYPDFY